jgi:hypothetical protein
MTVDISWEYQFKDGEYPEWTLVVVTEGMKGLLRTAAAQNLSIDPESLRIQAHTRQQIRKSTGRRTVAAAELRISAEAEEIDRSSGLPTVPELRGQETTVMFVDEHFNLDTPAIMGDFYPDQGCQYDGSPGYRCILPRNHMGDEHQVVFNREKRS